MNKKIVALAIAGSMAVSLSAFAAKGPMMKGQSHDHSHGNMNWQTGWYIGAGVNGDSQSVMDLNSSPDVFNGELSASDKVERSSGNVGFDVFVGRMVNEHFGMELGYTLVGTQEFKSKDAAGVKTDKVEVDQWNVHLVALGKLPIAHYFDVYAKGGVAYYNTDQEFKVIATGAKQTDTSHTMALTYGVGLDINWDNWGIRGEYNVIWPANNVRDDFYISDIIGANAYYRFS